MILQRQIHFICLTKILNLQKWGTHNIDFSFFVILHNRILHYIVFLPLLCKKEIGWTTSDATLVNL